jgi:hypothetical protein
VRTSQGLRFGFRHAATRLLVLALALASSIVVVPAAPVAAAPIKLSPGPAEGSLTVVAAQGNTVYAAWQDRGFTGSLQVMFKRSDDGGRSFGSPLPLSGFGASHPSLATYGDAVYVTWQQYSDPYGPAHTNREIWVITSADRGNSFGVAERIDRDIYDSLDPQVVATSDGGFIAWGDLHGDVYLSHAPQPGGVWSARLVTTGYRWDGPPSIGADGGNVAIAWTLITSTAMDVRAALSYDSGNTIGAPIVVSRAPTKWSLHPHVAVTETDVHVAWQQEPPGGGWGPALVASARDGTGSFAAPIALGEVRGEGDGPSIVGRDGLVAVAWAIKDGVSVSSSTDRGASFGSPARAATSGLSSFPVLGINRDLGPGPHATFDWSVPPRFGPDVQAPIGLIDYRTSSPEVALPATLATTIDGCASTLHGGHFAGYRWRIDGQVAAGTDCTLVVQFAPGSVHQVDLTVTQDGVEDTATRDVRVDDLLVVSIGDSVASGEGNPDIPGSLVPFSDPARWQDHQCDRTAKAGPALAARQLEDADPHTSITFVHLACSGARVLGPDVKTGGLLTPYEGIVPAAGATLPSQVEQLTTLVGTRPLDALLVSIGANDLKFSDVVKDCIVFPDCTTGSTKDAFDARLVDLPGHYAQLAQALGPIVPANRVFLSEYFDPTTTETGAWDLRCVAATPSQLLSLFLGIPSVLSLRVTDTEAQWASQYVGGKLNAGVQAAAALHGWHFVGGINAQFRDHGYCATDPWVVSIQESFTNQGDKNGAFHPNNAGQAAYGVALAGAVAGTWQAALATPPTPDPATRPPDTRGDVYLAFTDGPRMMATTLLLGPGGLHGSGTRQLNVDLSWWLPATHDTSFRPSVAVSDLGAWVGWTELSNPERSGTDMYQAFVSEAASGPPNLAVAKVGLVQAPADPAALVAGKSTAIQADIDSTFPLPKWVLVHYKVTNAAGTAVLEADTVVSVEPGPSTVYLQPPATAFLPVDGATLTAEVVLDPTDQLVETRKSDNRRTSSPLLVGASRKVKVLYVPVAGASCAGIVSLAAGARPLTQGALPIADGNLVQAVDCGMALDGSGGGPAGVTATLGKLDVLARTFGYDEVIGVAPALWLDANWKPGTVGVAPTPPRGGIPTAGFIVEQGAAPMVIAHELGHTFGQVHTPDLSAPGYWPATRATQRGVDLMNSFVVPNPWLSRDVFQYLWSRLISTAG